MQSLYDAEPGGAMNTQRGWPLDSKTTGQHRRLSRVRKGRYVKVDCLRATAASVRYCGMNSSILRYLPQKRPSGGDADNAHFACSNITAATDSPKRKSARPSRSSSPRGMPGNPAADTPVIFTRGDMRQARANQEVNSSAADIRANHSDGRSSGANITATGADGTLT